MKRHVLVLVALAVPFGVMAACASSGSGDTVGGDGGHGKEGSAPDGAGDDASSTADVFTGPGGGLSTCSSTGDPHAVVLAVDGESDEVRVLTQQGGTLIDHGLKFTGVNGPTRVAIRSDNKEAVVAWGSVSTGAPYGVLMLSIAPDGSAAAVVKNVQVGIERRPGGLAYVSDDRIVMTVDGSESEVITLDRQGGFFAEVGRTVASGNFPLKIDHRPTHAQILMPQHDFAASDNATHVSLLAANANNAFVTQGVIADVTPPSIDFGVHPGGDVAYSPTDNPEDPVTASDLTTTGILWLHTIDDTGVTNSTKIGLPRLASKMAVDPLGRFLVLPGNEYTLATPNSSSPDVTAYAFLTLPLETSGLPQLTVPESALYPGLLYDDLAISVTAHLIASHLLYPATVEAGQEYPLEILAQPTPGQWTVCQSMPLIGGAHIAIAH